MGAVLGRVALLRPDHLRVRADLAVSERFAAEEGHGRSARRQFTAPGMQSGTIPVLSACVRTERACTIRFRRLVIRVSGEG